MAEQRDRRDTRSTPGRQAANDGLAAFRPLELERIDHVVLGRETEILDGPIDRLFLELVDMRRRPISPNGTPPSEYRRSGW